MAKIMPVIMCGGSGTRMWPESRESLPKQFIPLIGQRSTFQSIVSVVSGPAVFDPAVVITNVDYRFRVAEQLREIGAEAVILLEPDRRDSAAAVGAAAAWAAAHDPKTVVAVLAADHCLRTNDCQALRWATRRRGGEIVTFGVCDPATGWLYSPQRPRALDPNAGSSGLEASRKRARAFIAGLSVNSALRLPGRRHAGELRVSSRRSRRRRGGGVGCEKDLGFSRPPDPFAKAPKSR
jgi:hypothetical protein